ncbi:universal stress protein [Streptomyces coacervatus]|uniref:Universal stress protein n=1 Tax=Streptomyces coacervatus TaxID=647381 RepID=A0ABP7GPQ3_9ACTN|nr:universal stress protein [Streptomyces coacervatus]MDF2264832.1 universal stress protein [Streptomyces coacervatus]
MNGPVVVGVDGTPSGLAAVEAAAWEADRRGVGLELAHALMWSAGHIPPGVAPWDPDGGGLRDRVNEALTDAERRARRVAPDVAITREVLVGEPVTVLRSESRAASLTVVGGSSAYGMRGRLHGSVAGRLTAHAGCPVLVVCGRQRRTGPVVLAQDESREAREAAEFAFAEASERGADLVILHTTPAARALSGLREKYPDLTVRTRPVRGRNHRALAEASADAQLVVVGVRRRNGSAAALSGPDGRAILRHAHYPVALVPSGKA